MHVGLVAANDVDYGLDLTNALVEAGMSVTLYLSFKHTALYMWGTEATETASQSDKLVERMYELGLVPRSCPVRLFHFPRVRDPRSLAVLRKMRQDLFRDKVDVVHILMGPGELWLAVLACLIRNLPVVSTMIIPKPNIGERLPVSILWIIAKLLAVGSHLVIVNGADQVEVVHSLYGISTSKIAYVPLGPRTTAIKWAKQNYCEESGTVLFPGKAQPRKGLEYLINAQSFISSQVPDAKIVIAAHGEDLKRCRAMIEDESKFEIHDGFLTGTELAAFFQKASLVTLPYLSASTSGLLMTAYVFGKPVVTTNVGSLPEYVENGVTGFLVPPADSEELAKAIVSLLCDAKQRLRMGENARHWVKEKQLSVAMETSKAYKTAKRIYRKE
jgi:glycosyltransferase involved in cell wall biosynthesis